MMTKHAIDCEWTGGFAQSNPYFAYPNPNLTSLPMLDNMANIPKLRRQQKVLWPEFSWETIPGESNSRCFQMFAHDISRIGYDCRGRVYSIICPQQGAYSKWLGALNVEITVTGQRGWVDENNQDNPMAADMTVVGKIWFSPSAKKNRKLKKLLKKIGLHGNRLLPFSKEHAIEVQTHKKGFPSQPTFELRAGQIPETLFKVPDFALHTHEKSLSGVAHLEVEIGKIMPTNSLMVDEFNKMVLEIFNMATGNMLREKNILTWNVWFTKPEEVCNKEWAEHAEKWRKSIDTDHGSPEGEGSKPRYYDGSKFKLTHESRLAAIIHNHKMLKFLERLSEVHRHERAIIKRFIDTIKKIT